MKPKAKNFITILIAGILFFAFGSPVWGEENQAKVRVGFFEFPNFQNVEEDGSFSGYSYDYLEAIAQYTGWEYEYITTSNFSECQELLKNGEIDIMGFLQKTPERQEIFDYPDIPTGISRSLLVTDKENHSLVYEDFESFDGITVGLQKDFARNRGFKDYCIENNFAVHTITYDTEELIDAVYTGKVDAALISSNQNSPDFRIIAQFDTSQVYYVTTKGNAKVLNGLNHALKKIRTTTPNFDKMLYKKYFDFADEQPVVLSKEEAKYLKEHPTIRVLYDATWPPFEIIQEDGAPHGIAVDILEAVSEAVGVNFEYTYANNREEKKAMFSTGAYDVLSAITYSYQWANDRKVFITQPYINIDYMAVYKKDEAEKHHLALPKGVYISEVLEKMAEDDVMISYYDTVEDCIEAVDNEEADYTFANAYEAEYYMTTPKYRSLKFRTVEGLSQQLSVGVSKDADPLLFSIITKGLASISQEELRDIIRVHLNQPKKSGFFDMMYTNPTQFIIILICLILALGAYLTVSILYTIKNKQNELLQISNKAKSNFLSHVSHDMRTPMNAIIGMSNLGMGCADLEKSKEYHEKVNQASKYLLRLINDILDMSMIENSKLKLYLEPYFCNEFIQSVETIMQVRAVEKGVIFHSHMSTDYKKAAMFDKLRLQQIVINLINNAIKFTSSGGKVDFIVDITTISPKRIKAKFIIRDTGAGMNPEFQKKMFEPFEQEMSVNFAINEGTGLGLAIVKQLVDLMGGTIQCQSQLGVGTEFIVEIEADIFQDEVEIGDEGVLVNEEILEGKKILLCEDNLLNTQIAKTLLEKKGCIVEHGENGQATIDLFTNSTIGYYDAILMDIRMPVVDGFEATAIIRALGRADAKSVPIIAMTANSFEEDIQQSLEVGMNAHLSKPIDAGDLFKTLAKAIENRKEK